jgi:hypothetical protein
LGAIGMVAVAPGIGLVLTAFLLALVPATQAPERLRSAHEAVFGGLALALVAVVAVRDSRWLVTLCLLAAFRLRLAGPRPWDVVARVVGRRATSCPSARCGGCRGSRGRPGRWRRPTCADTPRSRAAPERPALAALFAALFASADPAFGRLLGSAVPELRSATRRCGSSCAPSAPGCARHGVRRDAPPRLAGSVAMPPGRAAERGEWAVPLVLFYAVVAASWRCRRRRCSAGGTTSRVRPG